MNAKRLANDRQKKFAREYVKCWNGKQAALNAGYAEASRSRGRIQIDKK